ncbi:hypothetical protein BH23CHL5_BH23CHL5_26570 [soil metagenome]
MVNAFGASIGTSVAARLFGASSQPGERQSRTSILIPDLALKQHVRTALVNAVVQPASVTVMPPDSILFALREDARTDSNRFDGALVPMWQLGELIADELILPLADLHNAADSRSQANQELSEFPSIGQLRRFGDTRYATPLDANSLLLYYRTDLVGNAPDSIATWSDLIESSRSLSTPSINGVSLGLGRGSVGYTNFLALANPMFIGPQNASNFWFDPETFDSLIDREPFGETAALFLQLSDLGPRDQFNWTPAESCRHFLDGNSVFTIAPCDMVRLIPGSGFAEQIGIARLPGSHVYFDPSDGSAYSSDKPNTPGNAFGSNWGGIVRTSARDPEAAVTLLDSLSVVTASSPLDWSLGGGLCPGRPSQLPRNFAPADDRIVQELGYPNLLLSQFSDALEATLTAPLRFPHLRIPGANDYHSILDRAVHDLATAANTSISSVLRRAAAEFNVISDRLGRQRQLKMYRQSLQRR